LNFEPSNSLRSHRFGRSVAMELLERSERLDPEKSAVMERFAI
jgi:hypothetical protein